MFKLKRINGQYIVTYKNEDYVFNYHQHAWAFIFTIKRKMEEKL